jgi:hypothetical protein
MRPLWLHKTATNSINKVEIRVVETLTLMRAVG